MQVGSRHAQKATLQGQKVLMSSSNDKAKSWVAVCVVNFASDMLNNCPVYKLPAFEPSYAQA